MPKVETVTVELPAELLDQVRGAVAAGAYSSRDAAISDALWDWSGKREAVEPWDADELKGALRKADDHGGADVPMEEVMDRLEAKYKSIVEEGGGRS